MRKEELMYLSWAACYYLTYGDLFNAHHDLKEIFVWCWQRYQPSYGWVDASAMSKWILNNMILYGNPLGRKPRFS